MNQKHDFCVKYVGMNPRILSKTEIGSYYVEYEYEQFELNMPRKKSVTEMILSEKEVKAINEVNQ